MSVRSLRLLGHAFNVALSVGLSIALALTSPLQDVHRSGILLDTFRDIGLPAVLAVPEASALELPIVHVSGYVSVDTTWTAENIYVLDSSVTLNTGVTLTIEPGVVIKASGVTTKLSAYGTLVADGTAEQPVVFTSVQDDEHGGDTNGDGTATTPGPGQWDGIMVYATAGSSTFAYADVLYAGSSRTSAPYAAIQVQGGGPTLAHVRVSTSGEAALNLVGGTTSISDSTIDHSPAGVMITSASTVERCVFSDIAGSAVSVSAGSVSVRDNVFSGACGSAITIAGAATPQLSGNTGQGYGHSIVLGFPRSVSYNLVNEAIPYVVLDPLGIDAGVTLSMDPGVIVKFRGHSNAYTGIDGLDVKGTLLTNGTADQPVILTSLTDDSVGGDTNNDGDVTAPVPGEWDGIYLQATAGASRLTHTKVRYCDAVSAFPYGAIHVAGGAPVLDHVTLTEIGGTAVYIVGGTPVMSDCTVNAAPTGVTAGSTAAGTRIERCTFSGISSTAVNVAAGAPTVSDNLFVGACPGAILVDGDAAPVLSGNTGSGYNHRIALSSANRSVSWTLTKQPFPYVLDGSYLVVNSGVTLGVEPGVVVKMGASTGYISVYGTLLSAGTAADPVVFTSVTDDAHGGDTNNDGAATIPAPGAWRRILLNSTAGASQLVNTRVLYAGNGSYGALTIWGCSPWVDGVTVTKSSGPGVVVASGGAPIIRRSTITGNAGGGVSVASSTSGLWPTINWNDIYNNGTGGTANLSAPVGSGVDARYNYWGRTQGPRDLEQTYASCEPWLWYSFKTPKSAQVLGGNTACGIWGEPVNTATGNFYYEASDIVVPGVGPAISVGRTYNHQSAAAPDESVVLGGPSFDLEGPSFILGVRSVLGFGWTLDSESYVSALYIPASPAGEPPSTEARTREVVYPGGARMTFTLDGAGGYISPPGTLETLATHEGGGTTLTFVDGTVNLYSAAGTLSSVTDRFGNVVTYTRDSSGRITRIAGSGGRFIDFSYTGDLLTKIADNAGREVTYAYSAAGDLTTVTDMAGNVTTYTYDTSHRVTAVASAEHPATPFVSHTYDDQNRVNVQYDGYGNTGSLSYAEGATTITNNRGFTQLHQFDDEFRLTSETDGEGNVTSRTYNSAGLVDSVTDANGHTSTFTYDTNGNQTSSTDVAGHTTRASYDLANNNMLWSEDAEGVRTTYSYDASGTALVSVANPIATTLFEHYSSGLLKSTTLAGATTSYTYDEAGRMTSVTDALGATSTVEYDAAGRMTSATDALGRSSGFAYDATGRLTVASDPLGRTATFAYDKNGNRTSATDQLGKTTHFSYDVLDKLAGVTDPLQNSWAYTYDENYNLSTVTNPRGATTSYTYSASDRLTSTEDALGNVWGFTYDAAGNQLSRSYPTSATVTSTYAADDLLATSAYSSGESYAFSYTPAHRLSGVTDGSGWALSFSYNPVGWLLTATDTSDGNSFATAYAYDEAGRVASLDSDAAPAIAYAYDLAGRLTSLTLPGSSPATFTHDASGARTGGSLPNGDVTSYSYDGAGRIESIVTTAASGVIAESYTRDLAGRVTEDSQGTYAYDAAGRLVTWTAPTGAVTTYAYDAAYNLTGVSVDGSATASFEVDAADRITSPGFTYDEAGNLTSDGERAFSCDAAGRLTTVKDAATGTTIASYAYDAFNRRVSSTEGTATTFFHYDGASARVIAETDGSGATIASYTYDGAGQLFSMSRGGETYFYHTNARGDVVALSDRTGTVVNTYAYDPWGRPLSGTETVPNPYRYASYRYDAATGLYYCWNRYYAPELARFLMRDIYPGEIENPVTMNPYLYCGGDPVNAVDPSGAKGIVTLVEGAYATVTGASKVLRREVPGNILGTILWWQELGALNQEWAESDKSTAWLVQEQDQATHAWMIGCVPLVGPIWGTAYSLGCEADDDADPNPHNGWRLQNGSVHGPDGISFSIEEYERVYWRYSGSPTPDHLLHAQH